MRVRLDRDSVAAGDDVDSHEEVHEIDGRRPLERVVHHLLRERYLPQISGGHSCWIVRRSRRGDPLAVVATEQGDLSVFRLLDGTELDQQEAGDVLFFEYRAQEDVENVINRLSNRPA